MKSDNQSIYIYGLHGFLGCGDDFKALRQIVCQNPEVILKAPSYFDQINFENLDVVEFEKNILLDASYSQSTRKIFLGYSLGGRIGLQLMENNPNLFDHYIFCSTHPGLAYDQIKEKTERIQNDRVWIERIRHSDWSDFLTMWNDQSALKKSSILYRDQKSYSLDLLEAALDRHSLGRQNDYRLLIQQYQRSITWVVGQSDVKFSNIANELEQKKILFKNLKRISGGHRLLFDNPTDLAILVQQAFAP